MPAPPACAAASQQRPTIAHEKPLGFDHPAYKIRLEKKSKKMESGVRSERSGAISAPILPNSKHHFALWPKLVVDPLAKTDTTYNM